MSGKSTLMRSIGLGAVLAAAGAPMRARKLRLSLFSTCASLSIQDSIQEGVSRFKAELDRLRETIRLAREQPPVLFLIDEIFSGTNSRDRRVAAEAVVRTLVSAGAVGAISTHDLGLAEIADLPGLAGRNVHMGSRQGGGPLDFDYLLKPGVSTETNALAIARLAGVPI
jgi:DNA mismatch repair ATPase MutS